MMCRNDGYVYLRFKVMYSLSPNHMSQLRIVSYDGQTQVPKLRHDWPQCSHRHSFAKLAPTARSPIATKASNRQTASYVAPALCPQCSTATAYRSRLVLQTYQSPKGQQALDSSPSQLGTSIGQYWRLADPGHCNNQSTTRESSMRGHAHLWVRHLAHTHRSYRTYGTLGWDCAPTRYQGGIPC